MGLRRTLIIIGIVALGVFVTFGVEEIRFRFMNKDLLTEVETFQEENIELNTQNDDLSQQTKTLKAELQAKREEYEETISNLEQEAQGLKAANTNAAAFLAEVKTLQEENIELHTKNDDVTKQIEALRSQLDVETREYEGKLSEFEEERKSLQERISELEGVVSRARAILAP